MSPRPMQARFLSHSLHWLTGVFLLGLVLIFALRAVFGNFEADIRAQGENERARLFVGEEIVLGIQAIEKDLYRMAATQNAAAFRRIGNAIDERLKKLSHDLNVLKEGGTSTRAIRLNIEGFDEGMRQATYRPDRQDQAFVMELIEIQPHLDTVGLRVGELEGLLSARWDAVEQADRRRFFAAEERIAALLKQIPPYFERLDENANRLFFESDRRLRELEANLMNRHDALKRLETILIVVVVVLGGIASVLYLHRLADALDRARQARDEVERQRVQAAIMLDTLSDGVYATDLDGRITFINESAETILGVASHELIGKNAHESFHHTRPDGARFQRQFCPLVAVMRDAVALQGEEHFVRSDGRFVPVSYRSNPLMRNGQVTGSLVSFQDISARQKAQARIRLQQAGLDAAANMIVITDRDGRIEYVNPAFCQTTGYAADEVIGKLTSILGSGLHEPDFYRRMWETLRGGAPWEGELSNRRKNGDIYQEQMTVTPIREGGEITHFVAIKRDISDEARTRTRLKLLQAAIHEADQAILITDADADDLGPTIRYVNPAFCRITGFSTAEAVGLRTGILRGPDTDPAKVAFLKHALAAGESLVLEMNYRRKDGTPYVAELRYAPVPDENGRVAHYIAALSDISQRKEFEEALRRARDQALETARLKSEFLSTMSHEIRTPMNGIIGMSDLLLDTRLTDEQRELAVVVRDSAHSLLTVINDILDFSKIEAGKLGIEVTNFSPVNIVEGVSELLAAKAHEQGTSLMSFVDPALPDTLSGDPHRLRQVLLNLVGNAVKFTERGAIEISATRHERNGIASVRYEVRDTGIGISAEAQARLFQSFSQADSSTTRKFGGTGLGLAISKRLVELMNGEIGAVSREGEGSTFWFTHPLLAAAAEPGQAASPRRPAVAPAAMRVLVVDDRPFDRDVLKRYLASWHMRGDTAGDARQAIELMGAAARAGTPYHAAIIDFAMPDMNGIELGRRLRDDADYRGTRLILLTAWDRRDLFADARAAGFADCLVKPVRRVQLLNSLVADALRPSEPEPPPPHGDAPLIDLRDALENHRLILLAEDNPTNQRVAQLQINKLGYAVHVVGNGQEAVEAAEALPYAAILMDCQMPVVDGFEATATIRRAERASGHRIPIIAMTANAMEGDRERCVAAGMDDYVSKPIRSEALGAVLARWVRPASPHAGKAGGMQMSALPHAGPRQAPALDVKRLVEFLGDDPEIIRELLGVFRASTLGLLEKLRGAVARRDAATVKALAHEAKGACGNLGIDEMARIAQELEDVAAAADWTAIAPLAGVLVQTFADIQDVLHDPFGGTGA